MLSITAPTANTLETRFMADPFGSERFIVYASAGAASEAAASAEEPASG
jgi:hypothetical protein